MRVTWSVSGGIDSPSWNEGIANRVEHRWSRRWDGSNPDESKDCGQVLGGVEHVSRRRSCWDGGVIKIAGKAWGVV